MVEFNSWKTGKGTFCACCMLEPIQIYTLSFQDKLLLSFLMSLHLSSSKQSRPPYSWHQIFLVLFLFFFCPLAARRALRWPEEEAQLLLAELHHPRHSPGLTRPGMPRVFDGISTNFAATDLIPVTILKPSSFFFNSPGIPEIFILSLCLTRGSEKTTQWPLICLESSPRELSTCACEPLLTCLCWDNVGIWYHSFTPLVKLNSHFIVNWVLTEKTICERKSVLLEKTMVNIYEKRTHILSSTQQAICLFFGQ